MLVEQVKLAQVAVAYPVDGLQVGVIVAAYVQVAAPDELPPVLLFQVTAYVFADQVAVNV